jgi:hypothetical protein
MQLVIITSGQDGSYLAELLYEEQPNSSDLRLARSVGTNRDLGSLKKKFLSMLVVPSESY